MKSIVVTGELAVGSKGRSRGCLPVKGMDSKGKKGDSSVVLERLQQDHECASGS